MGSPSQVSLNGVVNGVNQLFTLYTGGSTAPDLAVYVAGIYMTPSTDYVISSVGSGVWAVTFQVAPTYAPVSALYFGDASPTPSYSTPVYTGAIKCEQRIMEAEMNGDTAPVLAGAPSQLRGLAELNRVQVDIMNGGPVVQTMGWKWNRIFPTPFLTNSWQQDYASNALNIAWLEGCQAVDVNNTTVPKPVIDVEASKDLTVTNLVGWPRYICWLQNYQLMYGTWGGNALNNEFGLSNPGANVEYVNPFGANVTPSNPITQIIDPNGNYWVLTTFGTCGSTQPSWPSSPSYPNYVSPNATATTVTDGTCVWTAINPNAQGFRLSPIASETGRVWQIRPRAQAKPVAYTSNESYITPIPDELYTYMSDGFQIRLGMKSHDAKTRAKYSAMYPLWIQSLDNAVRSGNREPDNFWIVPTDPLQQPSWGYFSPRPDYPYW
jgi:hypothetical protein